jgi:hypothetical protein
MIKVSIRNLNMFNDQYKAPRNRKLAERWKMKYATSVYQGETDRALRKQDAPTFAPGAFLPSGSVCMIGADNTAALYDASTNAVPNFVLKGTNEIGVQSEVGNIAGGIITTLPCTGNYRVHTCVFEQGEGVSYAVNDFITVVNADCNGEGTTSMFTKKGATPYTSVIAGVVCKPVYKDQMGNNTLTVDLMFLPKQG